MASSTNRTGWLAVLGVMLAAGVIAAGGDALPVQTDSPKLSAASSLGTTSTVCPTSAATGPATTSVTAVVARRDGAIPGGLIARSLAGVGDAAPVLQVTAPGSGATQAGVTTPLLLTATGSAVSAGAAAVYSTADSGADRGVTLGPCPAPVTDAWLVGLGADPTPGIPTPGVSTPGAPTSGVSTPGAPTSGVSTPGAPTSGVSTPGAPDRGSGPAQRSELVLSNPDPRQAKVDLRFFGPRGEIVVPGSPGVTIPAGATRRLDLASLAPSTDPVSVEVRTTEGRVSAVARDVRSSGATPQGADWHPASAAPTRDLVIPAVPGGSGERRLAVLNPGQRPATVSIQVLGPDGTFAPVGAALLPVDPASTAVIQLAAGLAGIPAGVRLTSDEPVSAVVLATSSVPGKTPDIAVATATGPLRQLGLAPVAYLPGAAATLVLSNAGTETVSARVQVSDLDGVSVSDESVPVADGTSSIRTIRSSRPVYLSVTSPPEADVYGGVSFAATTGPIAGLAAMALTSPDAAGLAPDVRFDPVVAR